MKLLSIGNSFSRDAQWYLHRIAAADGVDLYTENLYIGGCSLALHHKNMQHDEKAYVLDQNGPPAFSEFSIKEALRHCDWDVVTFQQASRVSSDYKTYQPYLNDLVNEVRSFIPGAKIVLHQTWAYKPVSKLLLEQTHFGTHENMFLKIRDAYDQAFREIGADLLIPSGELFLSLNQRNMANLYRDDKHAGYGIGRYALGLLWYSALTGRSVLNNSFCDFAEEIPSEIVETVKQCVEELPKEKLLNLE